MSDTLLCHAPCPECGSKDNVAVYDDGHGHCFGCGAHWPAGAFDGEQFVGVVEGAAATPASAELFLNLDIIPLPRRNLTQKTCQQYKYGLAPFTVDDRTINCQFATFYDDKGRPVAQKVRGSKAEVLPHRAREMRPIRESGPCGGIRDARAVHDLSHRVGQPEPLDVGSQRCAHLLFEQVE